ncbi:MAG TPA: asparagine synthase (glutamine-hydrolyzing) [Solirubrobacteraceae bacterium]|jgi:asparagine synthase (glutamine-hydrolysing)|nr:asparagine synthase (glutamine-hydrolyzing) [Solirubrobacteraceae bacterium]
MCGVAGVLHLDGAPADPGALRAMTRSLAHRGPDAEGHLDDGPMGLGHRRLSIIDLSDAGRQPMLTPDGRYALSYNGELYNFRELRRELAGLGCVFRSRTDSEVVLHALARWGTGALERFNGMFAFALWDRRERELLLARDRYGIKPMYHAMRGSTLLFGSEVKALLAHPALDAELDEEALAEYLAFQNCFGTRTLFRHVELLPPGTWRAYRVDGGGTRSGRFWDFTFAEEAEGDEGELQEELDRLFQQAVRRQLVADVPIGSYLSGGMDSGAITAVASRNLGSMCTYTVGFDMNTVSGMELAFDERTRAEYMSYVCRTEHYEMVLKAGDMERVMPRLVWHLEEPRVGQSYPNFYAAQLASKFGEVVLSGTGGDELFAGYPWRYYRGAVNRDLDDYVEKYVAYWQRLLPDDRRNDMLAPIADRVAGVRPQQLFRDVFPRGLAYPRRPEDYVNRSLYFEAKTFLHGLLVVEDKLSMAHSLETRLPFLDNELVDFAQRLPVRLKLGRLGELVALNQNGIAPEMQPFLERTRDGKLMLRQTMRRHIPDHVTELEKQGFSAPDATWFRGESLDYVRQRLCGPNARIFEHLDRTTVHELVGDHLGGRTNRRLLVWSLLCLEEWCRVFRDGESPFGWRYAAPAPGPELGEQVG